MAGNQYKRGASTEYRIMNELREQGFYPIRSAGSHGQIDILGIRKDKIVGIQSKRTKTRIANLDGHYEEELQKLQDIVQFIPENMVLEFWVWQDRKGWIMKKEMQI